MADLNSIVAYKRRRAKRLAERGYRADEPEETAVNNGNNGNNASTGGSKGGGHGNTRLPFGLCKRFGIGIEASWTPKDAWNALSGKGITPSGAYERLKRGEDPGKADKNSVKGTKKASTVQINGKEYNKLGGRKSALKEPDGLPWHLSGSVAGGDSKKTIGRFRTQTDMMSWLKDHGVEEYKDDETGKTVNPQEIDIPKAVLKGNGVAYTAVTLGVRDGKYVMIGKNYDGEKEIIQQCESVKDAKQKFEAAGGDVKDLKLSADLKRREKERLAWTTSEQKEYIEKDGVKFGNLKVKKSYESADAEAPWKISGTDEDGTKHTVGFKTKDDALTYLKQQGVRKVMIDGEYKPYDPQEHEAKSSEKVEPIEVAKKEEKPKSEFSGEELEKWKQDFPAKSENFGKKEKYADIYLTSNGTGIYSTYTFYGLDKDGVKTKLKSMRGMNNVVDYLRMYGKHPAESYIKDEALKKEFAKYARM